MVDRGIRGCLDLRQAVDWTFAPLHDNPVAMSHDAVIHLDDYRRRCGALAVRQACMPAGVDPIDQQALDRVVRRRRRLTVDQPLFRAGDPMAGLYVARQGTFKAVSVDVEGEEQVLAFFLPGELMGLDGLGQGRHRCDVVALEPAEACELTYEALIEAAASLPRLRAQLHRVVGQNIGRDLDHAALLTRRSAHERMALFLDDYIDRLCQLGEQGTAFRLPMSREDIARFLGLTPESVSRALARLQDQGMLTVRGRQVDVHDPAGLARITRGAA